MVVSSEFNFPLNKKENVIVKWGSESLKKRALSHIYTQKGEGSPALTIRYRAASFCRGPNDLKGYDIGSIYIRNLPPKSYRDALRYEVVFFAYYSVIFEVKEKEIIVYHHPEADVETLVDDVFQMALSEAVWAMNGYVLHSSSVVHDGKGLVLIGNSGCGKSTTCLSLLLDDFTLSGDDASLILPSGSGFDLIPMASEISVRVQSLPLFNNSNTIDLVSIGDRFFWRDAKLPHGNASLRVISMLHAAGDEYTIIERTLPEKFIKAFENHPPLHGFHKDDFVSLINELHEKGIFFVQATVGVSPEATAAAFVKCLENPEKDRWVARCPRRVTTISEARKSITASWNGQSGAGLGDVIPLLAHPADSIIKSCKQILGTEPIGSLEPMPWENYEELWPEIGVSTHGVDWVPTNELKAGTASLLRIADPRNVSECAWEWLKIAPILYPYLRHAAKAIGRQMLAAVDNAWYEYLARKYPPQLMIYLNDYCQLRCPYCYVIENIKKGRRYFQRNRIEPLLDWATSQSIRSIGLTGGEPTLYPDFQFLVDMICRRDIPFYFASNFIFDEKLRPHVARASSLEIHICDPGDYTAAQLKTLEDNLTWLETLNAPQIFRYNLWRRSTSDWDWVASLVERFEKASFSFAVPFPSRERNNRFVRREFQRSFSHVIVEFVERMKRRGLSPYTAKPYPLCFFSEDQAKWLLAGSALRSTCEIGASGCTRNLVVDPDLQMYPCIALDISPGAIDDFSDLKHLQKRMSSLVLNYFEKVDLDQCLDCELREWKLCMGGCLAYYRPN